VADGQDEADPAAQGLAPEASPVYPEVVKDRQHVTGQVLLAVHGGVVRLAAAAAAAAVDQDDREPAGERIHIAGMPPGAGVPDEPVQQDQRWPVAGQVVVDRHAGGVGEGHAGIIPGLS
jgi:hypothetical protein